MSPHSKRVFQRSKMKTAEERPKSAEEPGSQHPIEIWQVESKEVSGEEMDSEYNRILQYFEEGSAEEMDSQCKKILRYFDEGSKDEMASQYNKLLRHSKEPKTLEIKKQAASNDESGNTATSASETISSFLDELSSLEQPRAQLIHSRCPGKATLRKQSQSQYPDRKRPSEYYSAAMQRYLEEPFVDGGTVYFRQAMLDQSYGNQND